MFILSYSPFISKRTLECISPYINTNTSSSSLSPNIDDTFSKFIPKYKIYAVEMVLPCIPFVIFVVCDIFTTTALPPPPPPDLPEQNILCWNNINSILS
jgi:hypothetical protein